uniref:Uncharacterized protein n=1 Tax=Rhizophora mucronata TaxID=61149 RepID=A0A2P2QPK6_RHIMU
MCSGYQFVQIQICGFWGFLGDAVEYVITYQL